MSKSKNSSAKRTNGKAPPADAKPQAAYFLSLSVENVRCFGPKQTLDLSDGDGKPARWTIILGVNGTGKTTLLQSLVAFEMPPGGVSDYVKGYWLPNLGGFKLGDAQSYSRGDDRDSKWKVAFATTKSLTHTKNRIDEWGLQIYKTRTMSLSGFSSKADVRPPQCFAYGAGRRLGMASISGTESADPTRTLFSDQANLRSPQEWLLNLDYDASKPSAIQEQQRERLAQVKDLLLGMMPDDEISDIRLVSSGGTHPTHRVEFKTPYGWVPLHQLGYGYQILITWVADFANRMVERYPKSSDPFAEPAVCLVDEIDLHLHPQWQRKLIGYLTERFPNTQFIATAHSPLVVQAAADANIAVLRREGDHVVIDNDTGYIRNWRIDQILTSDLFGLESARPPQIDAQLAERKKILTKPRLTAADQRRLAEIEAEIGDMPTGESAQDVKMMEELRNTLDRLTKERRATG